MRKFLILMILLMSAAQARPIHIEFLHGEITSDNIADLGNLACRNHDKIVHLNMDIVWPENSTKVETNGFRRLIVYTDDIEYLFPYGSYEYQHGGYRIDGYFIVRSGGMHDGVTSDAFERVRDEPVLLNPHVVETSAKIGSGCT